MLAFIPSPHSGVVHLGPLTLHMYGRGPEAHGTYHFDPLPDGRTHVEFDIQFGPEVRGPKLLITRAIWGYFITKGMGQLRQIVRERVPATA